MKHFFNTLALSSLLMSQAMAGNLVVHEWGTFTSFMGSDGVLMEGLHHEDEPLPSFVYGLKKEAEVDPIPTPIPHPRPCNSKVGCFTLDALTQTHSELFPEAPISAGVTQKMETPVIYFYGDVGAKVNVEIDFPQGIITQYYPQASYNYPKLREATELKNSKFIFDVQLLGNNVVPTNYTPESSIWSPARKVPGANTVQTANGNREKFIFYRGIGDFISPLTVTSNANDELRLRSYDSEVSMAIVLNSNGEKGNFQIVEKISAKSGRVVAVPRLVDAYSYTDYVTRVKTVIATELVKNGLYENEAQSMVNTWERSYFKTPGIRVLYIVPNATKESILPLAIKPTPAELKRVLVGRVEIMTKNEEALYLQLLQQNGPSINKEAVFGRFYEPKLRRLLNIAPAHLKETISRLLK